MSGESRPIRSRDFPAQVSPRSCVPFLHQSERALSAARDHFAGFPSMLLIETGIWSIWRREVSVFEESGSVAWPSS